jgi:hypothetical protein
MILPVGSTIQPVARLAARMMILFQHRLSFSFSGWVTSIKQRWVSFRERRSPSLREIFLKIHWRGGQHSEFRVPKPKSGEHGCRTDDEAIALISTMATRWSDEDIAATLNRMRLPTGQGKTWTANRVSSLRRVRGIHAIDRLRRMENGLPCRKPP